MGVVVGGNMDVVARGTRWVILYRFNTHLSFLDAFLWVSAGY